MRAETGYTDVKLSVQNLNELSEKIALPTYDRSTLTAGIVHIGLGNFHRAHQAWYLHRLMQMGEAYDWAIIGAGVRAGDEAQRARLAAQDYLTTLIELDPKGRSAEVVGSMIGFVPVEPANGALIAQMAYPAIRIVALTVTEGGYYIDPVTKSFDATHADIVHDAANPSTPRTAFGAMVAALKLRRDAGTGPFTGQSCDNLQGNGNILRQTVVSLAAMSDSALAEWIDKSCSFPNAMVDCIVPATGPAELEIAYSFGVEDAAPVTHENFRQWVIEDDFCAGRPAWEKAGATMTDDVHAHEAMKIRILNGGHQLISNAGEILGVEHISGCMEHPLIAAYFRKVAQEEIVPQVSVVPDITAEEYVTLIEGRFANPQIVDTVRRVAFDGSARQTGFILPTLRDALANGTSIEGLALSQALWARMCAGTREDGSTIAPNDPIWNSLNAVALSAKDDPSLWLEQRTLYGDLADSTTFVASFTGWLNMIWSQSTEHTLKHYIGVNLT